MKHSKYIKVGRDIMFIYFPAVRKIKRSTEAPFPKKNMEQYT